MTGALVWLRDDLRLADNPALRAAIDHGGDVTVVYVLDDESPASVPPAPPAAGGSTTRSPHWTANSVTATRGWCCDGVRPPR